MSGSSIPGLVLGGEPRAQLLPPAVKQREKNRRARRLMAMFVVLAVGVAGLGIAWAYLQKTQAEQDLEAANEATTSILAQQLQYAEASQLANLVSQAASAETTVTQTEVLWAAAYIALRSHFPAEVTLTGYDFLVSAPWEQPLLPEGPIREPRVAVLTLDFSGDDYAPVAQFVSSVSSLYAFSDVKIDSVRLVDGVYVTTVKITLDTDAISGRFAEDAQPAVDAEEDQQ